MLHVMAGAAGALAFVAAWHEAGHLLVAKWLRIPVKRVSVGLGPTLWSVGSDDGFQFAVRILPACLSVAVLSRRAPDGRAQRPLVHDMLLAAAGPAANLLLAAGLFGCAHALKANPLLFSGCMAAAGLSAILALINLAPVPGLDGGHLLVLTIALLGRQLSPSEEQELHRHGIQVLTGVAILPLVVQVLGRFPEWPSV